MNGIPEEENVERRKKIDGKLRCEDERFFDDIHCVTFYMDEMVVFNIAVYMFEFFSPFALELMASSYFGLCVYFFICSIEIA